MSSAVVDDENNFSSRRGEWRTQQAQTRRRTPLDGAYHFWCTRNPTEWQSSFGGASQKIEREKKLYYLRVERWGACPHKNSSHLHYQDHHYQQSKRTTTSACKQENVLVRGTHATVVCHATIVGESE
ncbi:conserved hypothetical protein [Culex quinquefasciatus]|uniref:Uncharacterized protein n=1 Tax=Culex quinquefasciatus TaxID=7176 RepID=B0X2H5_CULQU|nr:conserved hypothetical protein [Culex quinquefasciatus]|eukprot:XP_001863847.1 conserved hypothetical protein [Culex quinquefasciatus]